MADLISDDFTGEDQKLPTGLNVLTILTIIGCILGYLLRIWGFVSAKTGYEKNKEMLESGKINEMPEFMRGFITKEGLELQKNALENKWPILILSFIAITLCLYGAFEMRKRKKQGYLLWLIGELIPMITTVLFVGATALKGIGLIAVFPTLVFIILYTANRKDLIY